MDKDTLASNNVVLNDTDVGGKVQAVDRQASKPRRQKKTVQRVVVQTRESATMRRSGSTMVQCTKHRTIVRKRRYLFIV